MKLLKSLMLSFASLSLLAGCDVSHYKLVGNNTTTTSTSVYSKHKLFKGTLYYSLNFDLQEDKDIAIELISESGSLSLFVYLSTDDPDSGLYSGNDLKNVSFSLNPHESGKYKFKVIGDEHKGSFSFNIRK